MKNKIRVIEDSITNQMEIECWANPTDTLIVRHVGVEPEKTFKMVALCARSELHDEQVTIWLTPDGVNRMVEHLLGLIAVEEEG